MAENENNWIRFRSVAYLRGRGVVFGASGLLPKAAMDRGSYALDCDVVPHTSLDMVDDDFSIFALQSLDFVFVGRRLEEVIEHKALLKSLVEKLKVGGHLILNVNLDLPYKPEFNGNYFSRKGIEELMKGCGAWLLKDTYERDGQFLGIFKRLKGSKELKYRVPSIKPKACIARYGAIGDMVMITPVIKRLHQEGYEVTVNVTPYAAPILENNPYIHNFVWQEKDAIPNQDLGPYWKEWASSYDKYINLSESIEGKLLMIQGRKEFYTSKAWRHSKTEVNYYDQGLLLAGFKDGLGQRGEMFFTNAEERRMAKFFEPLKDKFVIVWALKGSSHHKVYPLMSPLMEDYLNAHPDTVLITVGGPESTPMEFDHPQVIKKAGQWAIRETMLACKYAGLVVGPESSVINGASCFPTPKICLLSHSSHYNLCAYWENDYSLEPSQDLAPCYPCHQLHYYPGTKYPESCPQAEIADGETGEIVATGPVCAMGAITGARVLERIEEVKDKHYHKKVAV